MEAKNGGKEGSTMLDRTGDWCFEGGCTYLTNTDIVRDDDQGTEEGEALYLEPCIGMYD